MHVIKAKMELEGLDVSYIEKSPDELVPLAPPKEETKDDNSKVVFVVIIIVVFSLLILQ